MNVNGTMLLSESRIMQMNVGDSIATYTAVAQFAIRTV